MRQLSRVLVFLAGAALFGSGIVTSGLAQQAGGIEQSGLVGKLEGAGIAVGTARPQHFQEAPMLADLVRAGKLPPVEQRVPEDLLVIKPLREVGRYGGSLQRGFTGPGDSENGNRLMFADKPLFFDLTGSALTPALVKAYETSSDGKRTILHLRKGLRWSDGAPMTAEDFIFWFQEVYGNVDLVPSPAPELMAAGKPGRLVKIDDTTIAYEFDSSFFLFPRLLAGETIGSPTGSQVRAVGSWANDSPKPAALSAAALNDLLEKSENFTPFAPPTNSRALLPNSTSAALSVAVASA